MRIDRNTRAVVTGAGSGLGRAFAKDLAARGATVVVSDVSERTARDTAQAIAAAGGTAHAVVCDVTRADHVARLAGESAELAGDVTLLINNAGIGAGGAVGEASLETWRRVIDVNLWGVVHGCHYFVPGMRARRHGHVLNVASAAAFASGPGMGPYNVTKAAVVSLSETLAAEVASDGVAVTVLCPSFFRTNIAQDAVGAIDDGQRRFIESEMQRSKHGADDIARIALDAVERRRLYVVPHREIRWLWRAKRAMPSIYARVIAMLERRGTFSKS